MKSLQYDVQFKPKAVKDIGRLSSRIQARVLAKIEEMSDNLKGDVKRSTLSCRMKISLKSKRNSAITRIFVA